MADQAVPIGSIPHGASIIVRNIFAAGTIYTPAAGRVFHLVVAGITAANSTTAGNLSISAQPRNDTTTRQILRVEIGTHAAGDGEVNNYQFYSDLPCQPAVAITLAANAVSGGTNFSATIVGWEDAASF